MGHDDDGRVPLAILCGIFCLIIGISQFLYSFLAFASVILVDLLGIGVAIVSIPFTAVSEEPYEIPYPRALVKAIAVTGMGLSISLFASGCCCFFQRHASRLGLSISAAIGLLLACLHFFSSMPYMAAIYGGVVALLAALVFGDRACVRASTQYLQNEQESEFVVARCVDEGVE